MKILLCVVSYVLFLSATATLQAQPANDNFANRTVLVGGQLSVSGTTVGGSREGGEPNPFGFGGGMGPSVWYEWTAPSSASVAMAITGSFREVLGAYTGTAVNSLAQIALNSAGNGGTSTSISFTPVPGTAYKILVSGRSQASGTFTLTVTQAVSVNITAPANNTSVAIGTPVVIEVSATVPNPPVARVDFYRGGSLIGTDITAPYSFTNTPALGNNSYTAVGVDNNSLSYTSLAVNVTAVNPGAFITAPADGATILNLNPLTVSAQVLTGSGTVTNVDFYVDGAKFAEDTTNPFSVSWGGVTVGAHLFTVIGKLDNGITYTSAPVAVAVARSLMASNSNWKYLDNGSDQGTAWVASGFNDSSWLAGPAPLGYADSSGRPVLTTVSFGPDAANKYPTTYFRQSVLVTNVASYTNIVLRIERDDAIVLYLNGNEVYRNNIAAGQNYLSLATGNAADDGTASFTITLPANVLVEGTNVFAAEVHQDALTSSDIWFVMDLLGVPVILRNQFPTVVVTSPTNNSSLLAPASVSVTATAADTDGTVTNVSFRVQDIFGNEIALGNDATAPYEATWNSPTQGWYTVYAIASDNEGANGTSAGNFITVFDAIGTPRIQIFTPTNGSSFNGPTNVSLFAGSTSPNGVTNVEYRANGGFIGRVVFPSPTSPANVPFTWTNAASGTSLVTAVSFDATGIRGTSAPITIVVIPPPPNLAAPSILGLNPPAGATLTNLTSIQVLFTEPVTGVNASDLLVNGSPATGLSGSGSNYTFTVTQPAAGPVNITWVTGHGILDLGIPQFPFDETEVGQSWSYNILDGIPPTIASRVPAAGATVTNLTQITVNFSEAVQGVDAADLLINGSPAVGLSGGPTSYTFGFAQPAAGTVNISWDGGHGISDLASPANNFSPVSWTYTLDNRTILVQSNANWLFVKGQAEASSPIDAWRGLLFNDASWSNAPAPFFFGDPYSNGVPSFTLLSDMANNGYNSVYLRKKFTMSGAASVTNLFLVAQSDDGFIAWINGVEVLRYNMPAGDIPYNGSASSSTAEPNNTGAAYLSYTLPNANSYLVEGTNVLTIHAFNVVATPASSDFGINAQLYAFVLNPAAVAPRIASVSPAAGDVSFLTNITVTFSEPVSGVDAADLLVNGVAATSLISTTNTTYTFRFAQPAYGNVAITWAIGHGIQDFDAPPKPFDGTGAGATFSYSLMNPSTPTIAAKTPAAGATVTNLTQVTVNFSEPVTGVDAADFRINGAPATGVSGGPVNFTFTFAQPAYGTVTLGWATGHGITDQDVPANPFDASRPGSSWSYTLVDQIPPVVASKTPAAGAVVTNLTQLTVTFSEAVTGVNASDLLINGAPASSVTGSGAGPYTFTFASPNATTINITWAVAHGIADLAAAPNAFNATGPGATWSYSTPDTVAPSVATIEPAPFVTVKSLTSIRVTFTEPVVGVDTNKLLINNRRPLQVTGSGAGPYTFTLLPPTNGPVDVRWNQPGTITDLAQPSPNPFAGGEWSYILDPSATFAGKILINEIMYDPLGGAKSNEWVELRNISTNLINLAGWSFTKGISYTFPNVSMPAGSHLVIAASLPAFQLKYPGVTNALGGWTGSLANSDETIELTTALGEIVNSVHYASQGDWARRERGNGASPVASLTRSGSTATVTLFGHGYTANDQVILSGADQPEYNGRFTVASAGSSTFTITVSGTPATPATGSLTCRWVLDDTFSGWSWFTAAGGFGNSLELINPALPNDVGQNWLTSQNSGGTPGAANSVGTNNLAPLLQQVTHFPPVPRSTDPVVINARVRDELSNGVASVTLFYRNHTAASPGNFLTTNMLDNGTSSDGLAGDGLYGAVLPAAANGAVIEFYVSATDTGGRTRTWPAPSYETNGASLVPGQYANALYQVDNEAITNTMPVVRFILSGTERPLFPPSSRNSDAAFNGTIITTDGDGMKIRYLCDSRIRGAGSRSRTPVNNRMNIPNDNRWNKLDGFNLNAQFINAQLIGNNLAVKSGLPAEPARVVQYRINGSNPAPISAPANGSGSGAGWGSFLLLEAPNGDLAADLYPQNSGGNFYRASTGSHNSDLNYYGTDPNQYLSRGYYKTSNKTENDWTDFINLTIALSSVANNADYFQAIATNINVKEWMTYFAVGTLMNYSETSLFNGIGDDYALYSGLDDKRFVVLGHDFDTIFGWGDTTASYYPFNTNSSIFIMLNPPNGNGSPTTLQNVLKRFMTNANYAPIFYGEVKRLCDTTFNPTNLNPMMDQLLGTWGGNGPDANVIAGMKLWANNRRTVALSQIPLALTVIHGITTTSNSVLYTTSPTLALGGASHAIDTRKVLVSGLQATWSAYDVRWTNTVTLQPGINRILVQSLNSNDVEFARSTLEVWYDDGTTQSASGALTTDTIWTAANGPYNVTASLTVNSGVTLTIQPGTTIWLGSGVNITVASGGRLLAEGTATAPIRFTRVPSGANWGGLTVNGGAGTPETRIAYAHFENNNSTAIHSSGGTVFLDHLTFGNTAVQYISLDGSSFVVQDCVFPATTASFEPVHGTQGIKAGGRGIVCRNFWGKISGYNDAFDFTGGNRPGPILQVINNVFAGSDDDLLDLDSTDAWIEGNIFMHCHRNGASPDSSSAISGGSDNADNSQITAIGNIIYDCDHAANAKQTNFYTLINNTIVRQSRVGSIDTDAAVVILADDGTVAGLGMYLEGNIISDAEKLTRNATNSIVTFTNNIIHQLQGAPWTGLGGNNSTNNPLFQYVPQLSETTNFTSWAQAQILREWFTLRTESPAIGTGPGGRDKGGLIPHGAFITGEPIGVTPANSATLRVGINRTGNGIPPTGFPNGSGFTHYKWRLDGGAWSAETPVVTPITLNNLSSGQHYVEVSGKNDAGFYQDDTVLGSDATVTRSRTWTVNPAASALRLNEVLASNSSVSNHVGTTPDLIELWNSGSTTLDLSGVALSDDQGNPAKFVFPLNTMLAAGAYLTVFANNADATPGFHLGFNLPQSGGSVFLHDAVANGGALLDSIAFGGQLTDLSIGRLSDGSWALNQPTFGGPNRAAATGYPRNLRINEWLAIALAPINTDFIELYNADALPVALGGLFITDEPLGWPTRQQLAALSFIAGNGYLRLIADGDSGAGADHVNFTLAGDQGTIALFLPDLSPLDCIVYQPQLANISQGRSPNGSSSIAFFDTPTPGAPNPLITGPAANGGVLVINEVLALNDSLAELNGRSPDWVELYNGSTNTVNLGDRSLTDVAGAPRKFVFPANTLLAPGAWLRVLCDPGATNPGPLVNTNFALSGSGGAVYLYDALGSGGSLLNAIVYGLQVPNLSIGRVPDGSTNWVLTSPSPGTANGAVPSLGDPAALRVNEWMAEPGPGKDDWFEIYNPGSLPVALGNLFLTDDLANRTKFRIAPLSFLGYGTNGFIQFRADGNTGAGADHTSFSLRGAGEAVGISSASGTLIDGYQFPAQTAGVSQGRFPDGSTNVVFFPGTDSPGASNYRLLTTVAINEALTHTDEPLEDAIELRNLTGAPLDVSGWWLSDDNGTLQKYQIPLGTVLAANGFAVIYETHFTNRNEAAVAFALSSGGDEIVLSAATNGTLNGFRVGVKFGAAANGVSFGRYITSDGVEEFTAMSSRTFGADDPASVAEFRTGTGKTNAYPRVGPVLISEIMYHPPDIGTNDDTANEFIELFNAGTTPVPLYDPAAPTNTWHLRDAVDFNLPTGITLPAGGTLLVVSFDPINNPGALAAFRAHYMLDPSQPITGPWSGKLANDNDDIELRRPDAPSTNDVPYILVEHVRYYDNTPWNPLADGTGFSLQRVSATGFANDSTNWVATTPTPGPLASSTDTDGDGMPNDWEIANGFDPFNPNDAALDTDGDGLTNVQEYQLGTDPRDASSALRITSVALSGGNVVITFNAASNIVYNIDYTDALGTTWFLLQQIPAASTNRVIIRVVPASQPMRFFRLRLGAVSSEESPRFDSLPATIVPRWVCSPARRDKEPVPSPLAVVASAPQALLFPSTGPAFSPG